jgi:hypothetical protein
MLHQNIDCQKCACSNKLGTIYCRNCGTKLKFDKRMLDTQKNQKVKKILKRAVKAIFILILLSIIGMAFCPWWFPEVEKITDPEEITAVITTCKEIDDALAKKTSKAEYEFTPAEATLAANYLATEHEKAKKAQQASMGFSSAALDGTGKMGEKAELGGTVSSMELEPKTAPVKAAPNYQQSENARLIAWRKRKNEDAKNSGKPILSPNFDFIITVKDDKTLCVVLKDKWLKIIPARLELCIIPKLKINAKEKTQVLEYEIASARLGHLPIPLYLKEQIIELFEEMIMQERKWAKQYFAQIKNVEIVNDNINITFSK